MATSNVSFAKISATPTENAWSQSHNAGSLFLVVSLLAESEAEQKELPLLGKQLISNLQAEFFGLEEKTLETIEQAIKTAIQDIPSEIPLSLALTYIKDNILYVFAKDGGKILLKRDTKVGTILEADSPELASASGYLSTNDLILLQTKQFVTAIPHETLTSSLDYTLPSDIAETLSPHIHGGKEGAASAVIISFQGAALEEESQDEDEILPASTPTHETVSSIQDHSREHEIKQHMEHTPITNIPFKEASSQPPMERNEQDNHTSPLTTFQEKASNLIHSLPLPELHLSHRHKLILTVVIILCVVLIGSIYFAAHSQNNKKYQSLFEEAYASAQKDYDEGMSLLSLNTSLARDDFQRAKDTITQAKKNLPDASEEEQKLTELEAKVDEKLNETQGARAVEVKEVSEKDAPLLSLFAEKKAQSVTEDEKNWYYATSKAVFSVNKDTEKEEKLFDNDENWSKAVSLAVFSGNVYILDPSEGLLKFVPTSKGYSAGSYFSSNAPDLKKVVSMAIDASVWILFKDGTVSKYTRGTKDTFSLSELPGELSSPFSLLTSPEMKKIYVVDKGLSSILKIGKDGRFESGYQTEQIKDAQVIIVSHDEQNAYLLINSTFYSIAL